MRHRGPEGDVWRPRYPAGVSGGCGGKLIRGRDSVLLVLPGDHGFFEEPGQVVTIERPRRQLCYAVLRQGAFHERRDVSGLIAERAETVRKMQIVHELDDVVGKDFAGILEARAGNFGSENFSRF